MPIYEFVCRKCHARSSVLVRNAAKTPSPKCSACGSDELTRAVTTFALHRSTKTVWEESGTPEKAGPDYYKDPRNIGRWTEKKFKEMGMEVPGQVQEQIRAAREGELPDSIKGKL